MVLHLKYCFYSNQRKLPIKRLYFQKWNIVLYLKNRSCHYREVISSSAITVKNQQNAYRTRAVFSEMIPPLFFLLHALETDRWKCFTKECEDNTVYELSKNPHYWQYVYALPVSKFFRWIRVQQCLLMQTEFTDVFPTLYIIQICETLASKGSLYCKTQISFPWT